MKPATVQQETPNPPPRLALSSDRILLLKSAAIVILLMVLYHWVLFDMARDWWRFDAYSHGMLLPPLALYVAWINREQTFSLPVTNDLRGCWLSTLACLMFLLGALASEFFLMRFSFVVVITGLIWTFWGFERLRSLVFPVMLLATMVPLPAIVYNSLAAPLQLFASDVASRIAQASGISVYRDGNIIQLANTSLGVAEACSGLNSLSALMAGSVLLSFLVCMSVVSRVLLLLLAIPLAIFVNVIRVAGTAILADYHEEFAMGFYHYFSGWLVFVAGFVLLYLIARLLRMVFDKR